MPNWCLVTCEFHHPDYVVLKRAAVALEEERLFQEFIPEAAGDNGGARNNGEDKEAGPSREWCVGEWGCKWDASDVDLFDPPESNNDRDFSASFQTPWAPPIAGLKTLCLVHGFSIKAYYHEPGCEFAGIFRGSPQGCEEEYHDYGDCEGDIDAIREELGEELDDYFCITEEMRELKEFEEDRENNINNN
eukprot:UC1_evm1s471